MPAAAAGFVSGYQTFAAALAASWQAATVYAHSSVADVTEPKPALDGKFIIEDTAADIGAAFEAGLLRIRKYPGFRPDARLIGPVVAAGVCMEAEGIRPGMCLFFDYSLQPHGGDVVLFKATVGRNEVFGVKLLERLVGRWWLRATDGEDPILFLPREMPIKLLGPLVMSFQLPPDCATVRHANAQTAELLASAPPVQQPEEIARIGREALASRTAIDREEYEYRILKLGPILQPISNLAECPVELKAAIAEAEAATQQ